MSCCITQPKISYQKNQKKLEKYFDEVLITKQENYFLVTARDKARKPLYDYVVWFSYKIKINFIESALDSILYWIDALQDKDESQLSLFEDDDLFSENSMSSSNTIQKDEAIKKYSFFDLIDIDRYLYNENNYIDKLPTKDYIKNLIKKALSEVEAFNTNLSQDNSKQTMRLDWFWFDMSYKSFIEPASDIELEQRLLTSLRLFLVPYTQYKGMIVYTNNHIEETEQKTCYRFYLHRNKIEFSSSFEKTQLPTYSDLYDKELLTWVRKKFKIPLIEPISEDEVLKLAIKNYIDGFLWYGADTYNFIDKIQKFSTWQSFKSDILAFVKEQGIDTNGGGAYYLIDGFSVFYDFSKKGSIVIKNKHQANNINQNANLQTFENEIIVFDVQGDEIFKKAFDFYNKAFKQSLFDF